MIETILAAHHEINRSCSDNNQSGRTVEVYWEQYTAICRRISLQIWCFDQLRKNSIIASVIAVMGDSARFHKILCLKINCVKEHSFSEQQVEYLRKSVRDLCDAQRRDAGEREKMYILKRHSAKRSKKVLLKTI